MLIQFTLNGEEKNIDVSGTKRVTDLIRENFNLMKTRASCYQGSCGSCAILLDNHIVNSCSILAFELKGRSVMTAEGFMKTEEHQRIQHIFNKYQYDPCDFCRWGKIFTIHELIHSDTPLNSQALSQILKSSPCNCTSPTLLLTVAEEIIREVRVKK